MIARPDKVGGRRSTGQIHDGSKVRFGASERRRTRRQHEAVSGQPAARGTDGQVTLGGLQDGHRLTDDSGVCVCICEGWWYLHGSD